MRIQKISYFIISLLLLASCAPANVMVAVDEQVTQSIEAQPANPIPSQATPEQSPADEADECLKCHSDKDRLIETADAVEPIAESESKGVG